MKRNLLLTLLLVLLITSCAPTPAPVPALTTESAVATVDKFYKYINDAQNEDGLFKSWTLLSVAEQCNPRDQCVLSRFQENWWPWKVVYELYGCSPTRVVAKETLISRTGDTTVSPPAPRYWEYQITESETGLVINDKRVAQAPGSDCVLMTGESK